MSKIDGYYESFLVFEPELANACGVPAGETEVVSLTNDEKRIETFRRIESKCDSIAEEETDKDLLAGVDLLRSEARARREFLEFERAKLVPFRPLSEILLQGMGRRIKPAPRRVRLKKYVDDPTLVDQMIDKIREAQKDKRVPPLGDVVAFEERAARERLQYLRGLFANDGERFPEEDLAMLGYQIGRWRRFLRDELLVAARESPVLGQQNYVLYLKRYGVDRSVVGTIGTARAAYPNALQQFHEQLISDAMLHEIYDERVSPRMACLFFEDLAQEIHESVEAFADPETDEPVFDSPKLRVPAERSDRSADFFVPDVISIVVAEIVHGDRILRARAPMAAHRWIDRGEALRKACVLEALDRIAEKTSRRPRLIAAQRRALMIAEAFLDPELHTGITKIPDAMQLLTDDLRLTKKQAQVRLDRIFRTPGRAAAAALFREHRR